MRMVTFNVESSTMTRIKDRLRDIAVFASKLRGESEDASRKLESASTMRGLCEALILDGLDNRSVEDCAAMVVARPVKRGRPPLDPAVRGAFESSIVRTDRESIAHAVEKIQAMAKEHRERENERNSGRGRKKARG